MTPVTETGLQIFEGEPALMFRKTFHATHPDMMDNVCNDELRARYLVEGMFADVFPVVICGDFNAEPDSDLLETFRAKGFRDAHPPSFATFEDGYRAVAKELTLPEWNKRSITQRWLDNVMRLTSAVQ